MEKRSIYSKSDGHQGRKMQLRSAMSSSKCSVFSCKNKPKDTQLRRPGLAYYPFPRDKALLLSWKKFCNKSDNDFDESLVCADHFSPEDFIVTSGRDGSKKICRILKPTAIPSIYKPECIIEDSSEKCLVSNAMEINGQVEIDSKGDSCKIDNLISDLNEIGRLDAVKKQSEGNPTNEKLHVVESYSSQIRSRGPNHSRRNTKDIPIGQNKSAKEKFVNLLKDYPVLLDPSVAINIRSRKTNAIKKLAYAYKKKFGKHISRYQLRKKVDDMTKYIRDKLNKMKSNVTPAARLKKWEEDFMKLLQAKRVPIGIISHDRMEDTSRAIVPYNHNLPRNLLKSIIERNNSRQLSAETEETEKLSFEQLQRLLTLEQLKLIRLQQMQSQNEIERLKVKTITESRTEI